MRSAAARAWTRRALRSLRAAVARLLVTALAATTLAVATLKVTTPASAQQAGAPGAPGSQSGLGAAHPQSAGTVRLAMAPGSAPAPILPVELPAGHFVTLSYHDVVRDYRRTTEADSVETSALASQFGWLAQNGYTVIGVDDLLAARRGERALPRKAVWLTFDDGYQSFYTEVFPLLKAFGYKATLALVGAWLDAPADATVTYDDKPMPRSAFLSWEQLREMSASGLVELASHSYDSHQGLLANPQGNTMPKLTARRYDPQARGYESADAWRARVRDDLARNAELIERQTGRRPRVMAWPYGSYNGELLRIAESLGMPVTLTLDAGPNDIARPLSQVRRKYVNGNPNIGTFAAMVRDWDRVPDMIRPIHVDLDYVYDPDPEQQERNLGKLLDRIKAARAGTVFLQAFADPDGNGAADALYFPNRHLPMRADLFSRVAWQLRTRAGVAVYGWLPLMAFELPAGHPARDHRVVSRAPGAASAAYPRLTPYSPQVREAVREIYEDLALHTQLAGVLIHDDATLSDFEDASEWGRAHYAQQWQLPGSVESIRADPGLLSRWSALKTEHLSLFAREAADAVRWHHPGARIARNVYARPVLQPGSQQWFAQSLPDALKHFDWVAVMAMPYMEGAADPQRWLTELVQRVADVPGGLDRTVFEIQTRDWRTGAALPGATIEQHLRALQRAGARSIGYYPDDFLRDHPPLESVRPTISVSGPRSLTVLGP